MKWGDFFLDSQAIVGAAAEMALVTSRQWRTGYSLSRTIFLWENLFAGILKIISRFLLFFSLAATGFPL